MLVALFISFFLSFITLALPIFENICEQNALLVSCVHCSVQLFDVGVGLGSFIFVSMMVGFASQIGLFLKIHVDDDSIFSTKLDVW